MHLICLCDIIVCMCGTQAVDSTADTINRARSTAAAVSEDFEELQAPGPAAPFATTPLTSMPSVAPEKDDVRSTPLYQYHSDCHSTLVGHLLATFTLWYP